MNYDMNSSPSKLTTVQNSITEDFSQCAFDISTSILANKNYGTKCRQSSTTVVYSTMLSTIAFEDEILEIYIQFTTSERHNIIRFYSTLSAYITQLFPKSKDFSNYLNDLYTKALNNSTSSSKEHYIDLDISILPKSTSTFNLVKNKELTNLFEHCPVVKLSYLEINNYIRIVKTEGGFFILVQNTKVQKIVNLKCYTMPTKLEFEILLSIALENIGRNNYEDLVFKSRVNGDKHYCYISDFECLTNTGHSNAVIQYIANNPHFQLFFETVSRIDNLKFNYRIYPLLCATDVLFQRLRLNVSPYTHSQELEETVLVYNRILEKYGQQDPSELLQCFLSDLNQEFLNCFSSCPIYSAAIIPTKSDAIEAFQVLNNVDFNSLSPRPDSNRVKYENSKKSDSNSPPASIFQPAISQQETMQCVVKLYNFDANGMQITHSVQVLYNSNLTTHKVKIDLAKLTLAYSYGIVLVKEYNLGQNYKGLKAIDTESKLKDAFTGADFGLHCFTIKGSWNYENRGYAFINHGVKKNGQFVHFEYSLFTFSDANNRKLQDLFDHVIKIMQSASSVGLGFMDNDLQGIKKEYRKSNSLSSSETKIEDQSMLSNKSKGQNTHFSNLFSIYKLDGERLDFDMDISSMKIQTESQFVEMFPLANGSNFLVVWNEESSIKLDSEINYKFNRRNNNDLNFPLSNQYNNFEPIPLTTLLKLNLQFINSVKDLANRKTANEKTVNTNRSRYKSSLKLHIKDHLPLVRSQPNENRDLKFELESCYKSVEEKSNCIIDDWKSSILKLIDLSKFIIYLVLKLWIYKLSFGI